MAHHSGGYDSTAIRDVASRTCDCVVLLLLVTGHLTHMPHDRSVGKTSLSLFFDPMARSESLGFLPPPQAQSQLFHLGGTRRLLSALTRLARLHRLATR